MQEIREHDLVHVLWFESDGIHRRGDDHEWVSGHKVTRSGISFKYISELDDVITDNNHKYAITRPIIIDGGDGVLTAGGRHVVKNKWIDFVIYSGYDDGDFAKHHRGPVSASNAIKDASRKSAIKNAKGKTRCRIFVTARVYYTREINVAFAISPTEYVSITALFTKVDWDMVRNNLFRGTCCKEIVTMVNKYMENDIIDPYKPKDADDADDVDPEDANNDVNPEDADNN